MDATCISVQRLVALGVAVQWQQAGAVLIEAIKQTAWSGDPSEVAAQSDECLLTRGGAVVLLGDTARAAPAALVALLDDLLSVCADPDRLGVARDAGHAVAFLREVASRTSPQRRRVEIASLALRALAAQADRELADPSTPALPSSAPPRSAVPPRVATRARPPGARPSTARPPLVARPPSVAAPPRTMRRPPAKAPGPRPVMPRPWPQAATGPATVAPAAEPPPRPAPRFAPRPRSALPQSVAPVRDDTFTRDDDAVPSEWMATAPPPTPWWRSLPTAMGIATLGTGLAFLMRTGPPPSQPVTASTPAALASTALPWRALAPVPLAPPEQRPEDAGVVARRPLASPALASAALRPPAAASVPAAPSAPSVTSVPAAPSAPAAPAGVDDPIFSWTSRDVTPPQLASSAAGAVVLGPDDSPPGAYLEVLVDRAGTVQDARVLGQSAGSNDRYGATIAAARRWQFTPAELNGQAVRYTLRVALTP